MTLCDAIKSSDLVLGFSVALCILCHQTGSDNKLVLSNQCYKLGFSICTLTEVQNKMLT